MRESEREKIFVVPARSKKMREMESRKMLEADETTRNQKSNIDVVLAMFFLKPCADFIVSFLLIASIERNDSVAFHRVVHQKRQDRASTTTQHQKINNKNGRRGRGSRGDGPQARRAVGRALRA